MYFSILFDIGAALAVTALLAESYGFVRRKMVGAKLAPIIVGTAFGVMAMVQMFNPFEPFAGIIVDMRNVPIVLAGAFLGFRGAMCCVLIAAATRIGIGGVGVVSGVLGMMIASFAGLYWAKRTAKFEHRNLGHLLLLALGASSSLVAAFVLPYQMLTWFFSNAALPIVGVYLLAIPLIGALLERENKRLKHENRLAAAVTRDPESGLLTGAAFARDMPDALAYRPAGTFAGFLLLRPDMGLWRSVFGVLGGGGTSIPITRHTLLQHVDHGDLAAMCANGSVLIPLSAWEVENITRVKSALRGAVRSAPGLSATSGLIDMMLVEAADPTDFARLARNAAFSPRPQANTKPQDRAVGNQSQSQVRKETVYDPNKHDVLFAKANFLITRSQI